MTDETEETLPLAHAELLEEIVRALVADQDAVKVEESLDSHEGILKLRVYTSESDRGRIIGKKGVMMQMLRQLFTAIGATDEHLRILIDIDRGEKFSADMPTKNYRLRKIKTA